MYQAVHYLNHDGGTGATVSIEHGSGAVSTVHISLGAPTRKFISAGEGRHALAALCPGLGI